MANDDRYFLGDQEIALDSDAASQTLIRRLRQYLELRNVSVLLGNGCSLPLGAPLRMSELWLGFDAFADAATTRIDSPETFLRGCVDEPTQQRSASVFAG